MLATQWSIRDGRTVPTTETIALADGGVQIDSTFLYADLAGSSKIATALDRKTAAKTFKVFLSVTSKLIVDHGGSIASFDGDRVMGIFMGDRMNSRAAICALKINWAVQNVVEPKLKSYFKTLRESELAISHCVGIDTSTVLAVRGGIRGSNDLVWVGRAPNLAAKLSDLRIAPYRTVVSGTVFNKLAEDAKYGGDPKKLMWSERDYTWAGGTIKIHASSWTWAA